MSPLEIKEYIDPRGHNLFRRWVDQLDKAVQERIFARIRRMGVGHFGHGRHLGGGMHEAIFDIGPGYRLYYGYKEGRLVLLLGGGDKSGQSRDIRTAENCWREFLQRGAE